MITCRKYDLELDNDPFVQVDILAFASSKKCTIITIFSRLDGSPVIAHTLGSRAKKSHPISKPFLWRISFTAIPIRFCWCRHLHLYCVQFVFRLVEKTLHMRKNIAAFVAKRVVRKINIRKLTSNKKCMINNENSMNLNAIFTREVPFSFAFHFITNDWGQV